MAFTLVELLFAMAVFALVVLGVTTANLCGLRMFQITENKISTSDAARKSMGRLVDDIRNCKTTYVGDVTNGSFVAVADGQPQSGTGVIIYPTTNTTNFIVYFLEPSDSTFRRTTSVPGTTKILARTITNTVVFQARNWAGTVLTNSQDNRVIFLDLESYQPTRHGLVADYYKVETAVTRRALQ